MKYYRAQAKVYLNAIRHNILEIKKKLNDKTKLMVIVKADAYGHGAVPIAKALDKIGIDAYGVATIEEAIELRDAGIDKPILILGYTPREQYEMVVKYDIIQTVFQYDMAKALSDVGKAWGKTVKIHVKIDTGMNRIGFPDTEESISIIKGISQLENISIEGIFSHFACADESEKTSTNIQLDRFLRFYDILRRNKIEIPIRHISNSAGMIDIPEANLEMVRVGISIYGVYPSEWVDNSGIRLIPAMELKSHVIYIKEVEAGAGVSYGSTYKTKRKTKIATISLGYADGYSRNLSNCGRVIIRGQYAPIIGKICMDQFMVDVTDIKDVVQGDEVTLMGRDGDAYISIEELAELSHSFPYELLCTVGKRVPRVYYD
ncbi:MAG: alanine racemase [Clostridiales bacterium]|nr:alanine racemase [Clostridiales bacterium]